MSEYAGKVWNFDDMAEGQVRRVVHRPLCLWFILKFTTHELTPRINPPRYCPSAAKTKKFKDTGLSLPKDGGVSTKHANIVLREGRLLYARDFCLPDCLPARLPA